MSKFFELFGFDYCCLFVQEDLSSPLMSGYSYQMCEFDACTTYLDNSTLLHQGYADIIIRFDFNAFPKVEASVWFKNAIHKTYMHFYILIILFR